MNSTLTAQTGLDKYAAIEELAFDLRSTWDHRTDVIWRRLDEELWELSRNPWAVLQTVSKEKLDVCLADPQFSALVQQLQKTREEELKKETWFQANYPNSPLKCAVYFSMEFMLSEALPIYSGGLGNVAGDQLKAATDLGVPVIAVGLLYSRGYFRQFIDKNGEQQELYPYNDPGQLPIKPLRKANGEWLRLKFELPGWALWLRAWEARVGRTKLYLLDSNDIGNIPGHRGITSELYGGDHELRLKQEIVLGIGGWRLMDALGIHPEVCHMNEGHAAFAVLERARCFMMKNHIPFDAALATTRAGNVFTTHTAVAAGFDRYPSELIAKYLEKYAQSQLGISVEKLLSLGKVNSHEDFNMAYLAIRGSGHINAVSQLHGVVSRQLFQNLFPRWPVEEVPVGYVTNGVHVPSWDSPVADELWTEACGKERWLGKTEDLKQKINAVPDTKIWNMRNQTRSALIDYTRSRLSRQLLARGASEVDIEKSRSILNPHALTLGFARRFATYKRPDLLLTDEDRLLRILNNKERPVQLIIAGKAHPADQYGHALIKRWMNFISRHEARSHVVFLSDYDMLMTERLVQGVDVWINTPRRPWEASGTSGMKVLVNGGLNLSELDGWWVEAYTPEVGWALGDKKEHGEDPNWDREEANRLYTILESEVIPEFYSRDARGIPLAWTQRIRNSMALLTPHFSSNRSVREYTEKLYLPGAAAFHQRKENGGELGKKMIAWARELNDHWEKIGFGEVNISPKGENHQFDVGVYLNEIDPKAVKVELYSSILKKEMEYRGRIPNTEHGHIYQVQIPAAHDPGLFTARIIPHFPGVVVPLEFPKILWQR